MKKDGFYLNSSISFNSYTTMKIIKLRRPKLNKISTKEAFQNLMGTKPGFYITMSPGQWDNFLEEGYFRQGATLIELDENEKPIAAYRYKNVTT